MKFETPERRPRQSVEWASTSPPQYAGGRCRAGERLAQIAFGKQLGANWVRNWVLGEKRNSKSPWESGGPERSRTSDLRFRKPLLYPAELRDHYLFQ